jgi:hypothetical protein
MKKEEMKLELRKRGQQGQMAKRKRWRGGVTYHTGSDG